MFKEFEEVAIEKGSNNVTASMESQIFEQEINLYDDIALRFLHFLLTHFVWEKTTSHSWKVSVLNFIPFFIEYKSSCSMQCLTKAIHYVLKK